MTKNAEIAREKQHLREIVRAQKASHTMHLETMSQAVIQNLEKLHIFSHLSGTQLIYFVGKPQTCEIQTLPHIHALIRRHFDVWLPKTIVVEKALRWGLVRDPAHELATGAFSVLEPTTSVISQHQIDFTALSLIIVPGVAFDQQGHRMGYGQGYYDRFLATVLGKCPVVGLGFDFQVFPEIPHETHDAKVDFVVTDTRVIDASKA